MSTQGKTGGLLTSRPAEPHKNDYGMISRTGCAETGFELGTVLCTFTQTCCSGCRVHTRLGVLVKSELRIRGGQQAGTTEPSDCK